MFCCIYFLRWLSSALLWWSLWLSVPLSREPTALYTAIKNRRSIVQTLCMIPARGGSKRLKRKNVRELCGKLLLAYSIEAAVESDVFDTVIVSIEDEEIATVAEEYGATVPFTRPANLATDSAQVVDVIDHTLQYYDQQFSELGVLFPTSALGTASDVSQAYEKFTSHETAAFLMSVTDYQYSPVQALSKQDGYLKPFWDNQDVVESRSQDQPDLVVSNGAIYFMSVEAYKEQRTFYGDSLIGYHMPPERSVDIDEEFDLEFAEFLLERN